jgi:hypothetical protein
VLKERVLTHTPHVDDFEDDFEDDPDFDDDDKNDPDYYPDEDDDEGEDEDEEVDKEVRKILRPRKSRTAHPPTRSRVSKERGFFFILSLWTDLLQSKKPL